MNNPFPPDWDIPPWNAKAPVPCTKPMLLAWLEKHHGLVIPRTAPMGEVVTAIEDTYGERVPLTGGGAWPATWDCWAFVVTQEKQLRGGQLRLVPKEAK